MANEKKRNPLITEEDWWTVWFGLSILLVATVLGILTVSDSISAKKVPRLGKWISNPVDVFYRARTTRIDLDEATTLADLVDRINEKKPEAFAEIVPALGGVRLRVASSRTGEGETISLKTLLAGGKTALELTEEKPDPAGMGARAYVSQVLPAADVVIGRGRVTVTAQRVGLIVVPLLVTLICIMLLTSIGVRVMGQKVGRAKDVPRCEALSRVRSALRCLTLPCVRAGEDGRINRIFRDAAGPPHTDPDYPG